MKVNEYLTCINLQKKLKERIKGRIFITINNGVLNVNINPGRGINYKMNINDIYYKINIEDMANKIEFDYRRFISKRFFN